MCLLAKMKNTSKMRAGRVAGAALAAFAVGAPLAAAGVNAIQPGNHVGEIGSAYAEKKPDEIPVAASNEFYAYVKAGEQLWINYNLNSGVRGVTDQDGKTVQPGSDGYYPAATADGVWKIAYEPTTDVSGYIFNTADKGDQKWVMGVYSGNTRHEGRLWVKRLNMSQRYDGTFSERTLGGNAGSLTLYPVSSSGYVYKVVLKGINGLESVISATSSGINKVSTVDGKTVYTPTNQSYDTWYVDKASGYDAYAPKSGDLTARNWLQAENFNEAPSTTVYNMFFEEPSKDLPESIVPKVKTIADANVTWEGDTPTSGNGYATITGLDPEVTYVFEAAGKSQEFTGSDTAKVRVEAGDSIEKVKWKLTAKSQSQVHIMLDDVERFGGFTITQMNGSTAGDTTVYWDDSNLKRPTFDARPLSAVSALEGVDSNTATGVHGWLGVTDSRVEGLGLDSRDFNGGNSTTYGDGRIIDTWANSGEKREWEGEFEIKQPNPHISIVKTVREPEYAEGDTLHWDFKVTNDGETILNDVKVVEDEYTGTNPLTDVSCPKATLAIGESMMCSATSVASAKDVDADKVENTAHPEGNDPGGKRVKGDPSKAVTTPKPKPKPNEEKGDPHISIVKTVDEPTYKAGDTLHWKFKVTNDGKVDLTDVTVVEDEYTGTGKVENLSCPKTTLAVDESMDCSATSVASDKDAEADMVENTAHPEGNDPSGKRVKGDPSKAVTKPEPKPQTPPTTPPATPPAPVTPPATPPAPQESKPAALPVTGASALALAGGVALLAGGGAAGVAAARRRGK